VLLVVVLIYDDLGELHLIWDENHLIDGALERTQMGALTHGHCGVLTQEFFPLVFLTMLLPQRFDAELL
jgi:hypothetical protein